MEVTVSRVGGGEIARGGSLQGGGGYLTDKKGRRTTATQASLPLGRKRTLGGKRTPGGKRTVGSKRTFGGKWPPMVPEQPTTISTSTGYAREFPESTQLTNKHLLSTRQHSMG